MPQAPITILTVLRESALRSMNLNLLETEIASFLDSEMKFEDKRLEPIEASDREALYLDGEASQNPDGFRDRITVATEEEINRADEDVFDAGAGINLERDSRCFTEYEIG
ncbi:hypothetical protein DM860_015956 [Cuscuta australis]|uniref:Uncharacterized protein n=1 Tax=Cuscuta australis TaxID=267555 RepID=A0A328E2G8_9ASTE|nr:hypothetical protein DM860_015956 [Cuscuta australis]